MADLSKIQLPGGDIYDLKDASARILIQELNISKLDVTTYENNNVTVAASLNDLHDQLIWEDEE